MDGRDTLGVFDFGTLFQSLVRTLKTGTLRVSSRDTEKYLYMNAGKVEAVFTSQSRFLLGHILVRMRALDPADLDAVLQKQKTAMRRKPLGETLVDAGVIDASKLEEAVLYQMMEELLEVFYWETPRYQFYPGAIDETLPDVPRELNRVGATLPIDEILLYVTKTMDDIARFQAVCPSLRDVYRPLVDTSRLHTLPGYTPDDHAIFGLLDGCRCVADLFTDLLMIQYEVMERLCEFKKAGFIRAVDREELVELATASEPPLRARTRLDMLVRARELGLTDLTLWKHCAQVLTELDRTDEAIGEWLDYSRRCLAGGEAEEAVRGAEAAIELEGSNLSAHEQLLNIYESTGDTERQAGVLAKVARIHADRGHDRRSAEAMEQAAELAPHDRAVLEARARHYEEAGIAAAAGEAYRDLGRMLLEAGEVEATQAAFAKAVELTPASIRARDDLIGFHIQQGEVGAAAQEIQDLIPMLLSSATEKKEDPSEVLLSLRDRLVEADSQGEPVVFYLADAAIQCGLHGFAVDLLKKATIAARENGNLAVSARAVTKALELKPKNIGLLELAARVHRARGDALAAAEQHRALATMYASVGDVVKQEKALRALLDCAPHDAGGLDGLAKLLRQRGAKEESAEQIFRLGHLHYATGRVKWAVECYDEACRLVPGESRFARFLSVALAEVLGKGDHLKGTAGILDMFIEKGDHLAVLQASVPPLSFGLAPPIRRSAVRESYQQLGKLI
jgi:tetratricopeptide (TPR) repeat protein